jgi:hypothetical protein
MGSAEMAILSGQSAYRRMTMPRPGVPRMDDAIKNIARPFPSPPPPDAPGMEGDLPLPRDVHAFLLFGIFTLLLLYALYFAAHMLLPVMFAFLLQLLLQPAMRVLCKLRVPKTAAALLLLLAMCGAVGMLVSSLAVPASQWIAKAPESRSAPCCSAEHAVY